MELESQARPCVSPDASDGEWTAVESPNKGGPVGSLAGWIGPAQYRRRLQFESFALGRQRETLGDTDDLLERLILYGRRRCFLRPEQRGGTEHDNRGGKTTT